MKQPPAPRPRPFARYVARALRQGAAALLALLALTGGAAQAAVVEEHTARPYPVHAAPGQPLRQALDAASPITEGGRRFHGHTRWSVQWRYRWWREASGRCRITGVTTRLSSEVQLPALHGASAAQHAVFERYLRALARHEQGHVQFGREAAQAIDQAIAQLPEAPDCDTLQREANALGRRLLREHVEREKAYDRGTGHGASQGARLQED